MISALEKPNIAIIIYSNVINVSRPSNGCHHRNFETPSEKWWRIHVSIAVQRACEGGLVTHSRLHSNMWWRWDWFWWHITLLGAAPSVTIRLGEQSRPYREGCAGQWACGEWASFCLTHRNILLLLQPTHKHSYWIPAETQHINVNTWVIKFPLQYFLGLKTRFFYTFIF